MEIHMVSAPWIKIALIGVMLHTELAELMRLVSTCVRAFSYLSDYACWHSQPITLS